MKEKNVIIMADLHFGIKRFNIDTLRNQISLFTEQIFPYMEEKNIDTIYQLGDFFDNRTMADIGWLETLKKEFFELLKEKNLKIFTLKGNHDIFHRESREIALVDTFAELYPDNFFVYSDREKITLLEQEIYIVPWITKDETLTQEEICDVDYIFGHFETRGFYMVPGHCDTKSSLNTEFFSQNPRIKGVYSGHYHLRDTKGLVKYLGAAYSLNWSDHNDLRGFYEFDGTGLEFVENITTKKFIKVKYNDENELGEIEVKGYNKLPLYFNKEEYKDFLPNLNGHEIKTFINKSANESHNEIIDSMKTADIETTVINNQELSSIIGADYIQDEESITHKDTRTLIMDSLKAANSDLIPLLTEIMSEIDSEINKEI